MLADVAPMEFVAIPAGEFVMGSPFIKRIDNDDERPHRVSLDGFAMSIHEVSLAQWEAVMGTRPSDCEAGCEDDHPVQNVSWNDACRFTIALTERENAARRASGAELLSPCYVEAGVGCDWPEASRKQLHRLSAWRDLRESARVVACLPSDPIRPQQSTTDLGLSRRAWALTGVSATCSRAWTPRRKVARTLALATRPHSSGDTMRASPSAKRHIIGILARSRARTRWPSPRSRRNTSASAQLTSRS